MFTSVFGLKVLKKNRSYICIIIRKKVNNKEVAEVSFYYEEKRIFKLCYILWLNRSAMLDCINLRLYQCYSGYTPLDASR